MVFQLVGYSHFKSKKGSDCTALHLIDLKPLHNGTGNAVVTKVTSSDIKNLELGKVDIAFNDRGFVEDVKVVK